VFRTSLPPLEFCTGAWNQIESLLNDHGEVGLALFRVHLHRAEGVALEMGDFISKLKKVNPFVRSDYEAALCLWNSEEKVSQVILESGFQGESAIFCFKGVEPEQFPSCLDQYDLMFPP
jgi:hypothetical protein